MLLAVAATLLQPTWTLLLGGDVMLNGIDPASRPLKSIASFTRSADLAIVNLEIPLTSARSATTRKTSAQLKAKTQFVLKAHPHHVGSLWGAGIDAVTLGNNHAMDYGPEGLSEMTGLLSAKAIAYAGAGSGSAVAWSPAVLNVRGFKVALLSMLAFKTHSALNTCWPATDDSPGIATLYLAGVIGESAKVRVRQLVTTAKRDADFLIVALHWGVEKETVPDRYQVSLGRAFVDAGADLVVGHHPHVLQGGETYSRKPILYSLGNLISPRPGSTALFQLTFQGTELQAVAAAPCEIRDGKVGPLPDPRDRQALASFRQLGEALRKRFPSKSSAALNVELLKGPS